MVNPGDTVKFMHYGTPKVGTVEAVRGQIVWLTCGRWLHLASVEPTHKETPKGE